MGGDTAADTSGGGNGPSVAPVPTHLEITAGPLDADELGRLHGWWRAANYLSVGQIYLLANPLLCEPLRPEHVKPRLLGHFGTVPGLNLVWAHANRAILQRDLDAVFVAGPGHGGPGPNACAWLEGSYTDRYSHVARDAEGMAELFRQFSFPGGVPSHCAPETPGSFHEGGELGYSLLHATGAVLDHPGLVAFCVIGDGEAETGPLAAAGRPPGSSTLAATAPRCRSCTSTATRSPTPRCRRGSPKPISSTSAVATAMTPSWSAATSRAPSISNSPPPSTRLSMPSPAIRNRRPPASAPTAGGGGR